jgi:hypothetical protein
MGELVFLDPYDVVAGALTVADGSLVEIDAGKTADRVYRYDLKIFNTVTRKLDEGTLYHLTMIDTWDKWRLLTRKGSLNMTSSEALAAIAKDCGMAYSGAATNDRQVWLPLADQNATFARRIGARGFVDSRSCMAMGVTLGGELRYVNLNGMDLNTKGYEFCHGTQQGIWVTDWRIRSNSGAANQSGGYATTDHQFSTVEGKSNTQNKVQLQRKSNILNLNLEAKAAAGDGKILMRPIDAGNNHPAAQSALYQNKRILQLLSTSTSIVTPYDPNVDLLEPVLFSNFIANKQSGNIALDAKTSGIFIVAGKAIHIGSDMMYNERYQFIREGQNMDNSQKVN